jgi:hypothetical protein
VDFPDDENGDVLRRMLAAGDDLSQRRDIDFVVVFPDESAAQTFAGEITSRGHRVEVEQTGTAKNLPWDVRIVRNMVPTHETITEFEQQLEAEASQYGGRNDGWGCLSQSADTSEKS